MPALTFIKILFPRVYSFRKMAMKWCDLTWPGKSPKSNLHHLRKISAGFKMTVLTPKSGIAQLKNSKHHLLKITRLKYTVILSKSWKDLELVFSRQKRVKNKLEMFVIRCTNIWTNFYGDAKDFEVCGFIKTKKI